jgi:predicted nuclease of restriction endonuclease-like (RecB) superfamily
MKRRKDSVVVSPEYRTFIEELKRRVLSARLSAARAVNRDVILLYWDIGRAIVEKQEHLGWGESVVEMVAADLQREFPASRSFSSDNLWRMRQVYLAYSTVELLGQVVPEMQRVVSASKDGSVLGQSVPQSTMLDLLFNHRFLKAMVAFELKVGPFEPEYAGKMDFYLNLLNDKERADGDNPSIGIILCAEKDDVEVEYALKTKRNPIGVAEYHLQPKLPGSLKGKLPTAKQLADVVRTALPARGGK